ncbi:MAG: 4-hydroxy-tetrahydrodipicolinate synthase [Firmicutes bacterium]|nr:4-hydroxy-tetrahydrodipicolinate synthase [Bacillota bacterium]
MIKIPIYKGVGTALVTPFKKDKTIDLDGFIRLINFQTDNDIDALIVLGTTSESPTISDEEFNMLVKTAIKHKKHAKIIVGIGKNDTMSSIRLAKKAQKLGADALMAVTPYYNKPPQQGLITHFKAIAKAVKLPIMLYNVPSRTGVHLDAKSCLELSKIKNIIALKEAGGDFSHILKVRALCGENLHLYSGNDDNVTAMMSLGAFGVVSVVANAFPQQVRLITESALREDYITSTKAQCELLPVIESAFSMTNPIPIKAMLSKIGICEEWVRLPLATMSKIKKKKLKYPINN